MIRVLHLIDDAKLGGVNRTLDAQAELLAGEIEARRHLLGPGQPEPDLEGIDVVIVHFTLAWRKMPFMLRLWSRLGGRCLVIVEHSYTEAYERCLVPNRLRFRSMLRLGMALADKVVAVSHGQARWLREAGIAPARKVQVIEPLSDLAPFHAVPPLRPGRGPLRLGYYGRYAPQKGLEQLIDAMRLLPPGTATLAMAGYGPDEEALRAAAADLPEVTIGGPTSHPEAFLEDVDAIVMPSRWEAYGQVGVETRAAGRALLVADLDGLTEQVPPELLIPNATPEALAARIRWLSHQDVVGLGESLRATAADAQDRHHRGWLSLLRGLKPELA
ncbi:glycosyltransferase [Rhodovarius crocodyli]|uniref:Glycosyltransferase n=1 Tax=Rhodovarius crocodyli TaxID=1979269 RepID=A0A437MGH4_9PROT|nr:glycosyltransferase family 4 protein [Rhodovarius crocodyli]RVT96749.1 glycosyltransferase [Rhodovarius crocodyli]